ncbi:amine sulfotransferase-like isoform X2 [Cebidichthys violaceus]|uniref:amine sulfotransferase-like isoform X2 n=1 Tax=Cebidichthys violaceus TaxID=271503 RepID=UPI0035CC54CE
MVFIFRHIFLYFTVVIKDVLQSLHGCHPLFLFFFFLDLLKNQWKRVQALPQTFWGLVAARIFVHTTASSEVVIYVARNPKDVLVSYFYFHKVANMLETPRDFDDFFEKFMRGNVFGSSWFEHIKTWYSHKDDINMLFITYEEMIQDLHSAVERIALFLGKELADEQLADVVKHSTFNNMKNIPQANYERVPGELLSHHQGRFMRKGTIGDWKTHFTVAQNEMFDKVFHGEMANIPLVFIWDIKDFA